MGQAVLANINPQLLIWARKEQGYDINFVKEKLKLKHLLLWENGEEKPTFPQILKLADFYKRPSALFYLKNPPEAKKEKCIDFRSQTHFHANDLSPETRTEIRVCESRRRWALEFSHYLDVSTKFNLPAVTLNSDIEQAVLEIRKKLGIDQNEIFKHKNDQQTLQYWSDKLENNNALIFHSITLNGWNRSFKEIRGTGSYYSDYPWILINSQEHPRGQLFTLGHELAHLLLHGCSICTLDEENPDQSLAQVEQFCNQFSASLYIPKTVFENFRKQNNLGFNGIEQLDNSVAKIKKYFHISSEAGARRLFSLGYAPKSYYLNVRQRQIEALDETRQKSGGGDGTKYYIRVITWNGIKYTNLVFNAFHENKISYAEVAQSLRTDVKHLESIERELYR